MYVEYVNELEKRSAFNTDISSGKYRSFIRRNETIKTLIQEVLNGDKESQNKEF